MDRRTKRISCAGYLSEAHPFATAFMVVIFGFCAAYSGWTRIGLEGMKVTSITAGEATMEDVFLTLS